MAKKQKNKISVQKIFTIIMIIAMIAMYISSLFIY